MLRQARPTGSAAEAEFVDPAISPKERRIAKESPRYPIVQIKTTGHVIAIQIIVTARRRKADLSGDTLWARHERPQQ